MNRITGNIFICLSLVIWPLFSSYTHASDSNLLTLSDNYEIYDPELYLQMQSVDDVLGYINANFKGKTNSNEFINYIALTISRRFYHGYSYYSANDNWIASLTGKLFWNDLAAIVVPDDILKHPNAACSQQAIVLMACARKFGLDYRTVGFNHHFALEIKANGKWHYVDPNIEIIPPKGSVEELMKSGEFFSLYEKKMNKAAMDKILGGIRYGNVNAYPAVKTSFFQKLTGFLSTYFIFFIFFAEVFIFISYYKRETEFFIFLS